MKLNYLNQLITQSIKKLTFASKRYRLYLIDILSDKDLGYYPIEKLHKLSSDDRGDNPINRPTTYYNSKKTDHQ